MARVKPSSSRARIRVNLKIISDISSEMLWMVEKFVVFSQCGVEYSLWFCVSKIISSWYEIHTEMKTSLTTFPCILDGSVHACERVKGILYGVLL